MADHQLHEHNRGNRYSRLWLAVEMRCFTVIRLFSRPLQVAEALSPMKHMQTFCRAFGYV